MPTWVTGLQKHYAADNQRAFVLPYDDDDDVLKMGDNLKIKTDSIINDYVVYWNQKLGTGISGPVRACMKRSSKERFAVKCLPDNCKMRTEVNLHVMCSNHEHIVTVYDVYANNVQFPGETQAKPRLLMVLELMEGGELFDRISQERYFTEKKASLYLLQIAHAVKRCHSLNIAHRDLKPENLLLKDNSENCIVKLTDFGFAKIDDGKLMTPHFTPYYVAPQVLEAYRYRSRLRQGIIQTSKPCTYDKSCDMWSLGVILYIMLCGYPPFYSETPTRQITSEMKRKILSGEYEFPEEDWKFISEAAKDIVRSLLHVDPGNRMTVDDLLNHPWLNKNAPDTKLLSPSVMLNKLAQEDIKFAHAEQLSSMRQPDIEIRLKPLEEANNPIIRKRHYRNSSDSGDTDSDFNVKKTTESVKLKAIRDIIAHCILSSVADGDQKMLTNLTIKALQLNDNLCDFQDIIQLCGWDGEKFKEKVNRKQLAQYLSELVQSRPERP